MSEHAPAPAVRAFLTRLGHLFYVCNPKKLALAADESAVDIAGPATPLFFVLIGLEYACMALRWPDRVPFRLNDVLTSAGLGVTQQLVMKVVSQFLNLDAPYKHIYNNYRLVDLDVKRYPLVTWVSLMLGVDLAYYAAHRALHVLHAGWASHSVHHSGEDYNLATSLRQGAIQPIFSYPLFTLPLALAFPHSSVAMHVQLNFLYQFWIHTEVVGSLGVLEHVMNTPRHHRMHHRPPGNCNYAGVLIIWDRLFGTFEAEAERQDYYGLAKSPATFDNVELNFQHWRKMALIPGTWLRRFFTLRAKHPMVVKPEALLEPLPPIGWEPPSKPRRPKHDGFAGPGVSAPQAILALGAFALALACMELSSGRSKRRTAAISGAGILSLHAMGKLLDTGSVGSFAAPQVAALLALGLGLRGPLGA